MVDSRRPSREIRPKRLACIREPQLPDDRSTFLRDHSCSLRRMRPPLHARSGERMGVRGT